MPVYQITYQTQNTYSSLVPEAVMEFLVLPASDEGQEIVDYKLDVFPRVKPYITQNMYGFSLLHFRLKNLEKYFSFKLEATVKKATVNPFDFISLPISEEKRIRETDDFLIDHFPFLQTGILTRLPADYNCPVIGEEELIFDFAKRVNSFIHNDFRYDQNITDPHRQLAQTIQEKKGVCQDFAHLMLAILRKNNILARYVSGYLNPGENHTGTGAVHAWVQALIPGAGWVGFDPTNNILEDHHFIKIAHGTDFNDCSTLKGALKGPGTNQTDYHVLVEEQIKGINQ